MSIRTSLDAEAKLSIDESSCEEWSTRLEAAIVHASSLSGLSFTIENNVSQYLKRGKMSQDHYRGGS